MGYVKRKGLQSVSKLNLAPLALSTPTLAIGPPLFKSFGAGVAWTNWVTNVGRAIGPVIPDDRRSRNPRRCTAYYACYSGE